MTNVNRLFPVRLNYYAVGGVITSVTYWGKKCDVTPRVYTQIYMLYMQENACFYRAVLRVEDA
jgi:hypothetical protein